MAFPVAHVEIKNFEACATNPIEAVNTIYVSGAFGEVVFLRNIETTFSKNIIASKLLEIQIPKTLQDFSVVAKGKSQIYQNILK
jgi:hypothetical protein